MAPGNAVQLKCQRGKLINSMIDNLLFDYGIRKICCQNCIIEQGNIFYNLMDPNSSFILS